METKICSKCNIEKSIDCFSRRKNRNNKPQPYCKECARIISKQYRTKYTSTTTNIHEKECKSCNIVKSISEFHKDKSRPTGHHYNCKTCRNSNIKKDRMKNKSKYTTRHKLWLKTPKGQESIQRNKFLNNIRTRILKAVQHNYKTSSTTELLGCSIECLKEHLQQTAINNGYADFNINSYSGSEFHIDHIIPCASFDLSDPEQQKQCFHYTNLQILTAQENLIKNNKIL